MALYLDHILVDLVEDSPNLFILQFLDGYYDFAREVAGKEDNDHPPVRPRQHFQLILNVCWLCGKCNTSAMEELTVL